MANGLSTESGRGFPQGFAAGHRMQYHMFPQVGRPFCAPWSPHSPPPDHPHRQFRQVPGHHMGCDHAILASPFVAPAASGVPRGFRAIFSVDPPPRSRARRCGRPGGWFCIFGAFCCVYDTVAKVGVLEREIHKGWLVGRLIIDTVRRLPFSSAPTLPPPHGCPIRIFLVRSGGWRITKCAKVKTD